MARLLYFRTPKRIVNPDAVAYARRLIARIEQRRLEMAAEAGYAPQTVDGVCAICLGSGKLVRADNLWKRCPCNN